MITIKLDIKLKEQDKNAILKYQNQYSNLLHVYYNRLLDGISQTQCKHLELNNTELLGSWLRQSCVYEANSLIQKNKDKKVIFGGKYNFFRRMKKLISKEQFEENRLSPIYSIGEPRCLGNRLFRIVDDTSINFNPRRSESYKICFKCNSRKYQSYLRLLKEHQTLKDVSITYKLSTKNIWISFDEMILKSELKNISKVKNRFIAIDMNPNYIGYSVIDWHDSEKFNVIDKGVLSLKNLNDKENSYQRETKCNSNDKKIKYFSDKRRFEVLECVQFLKEKMIHYGCECFSIEDLNFKNSDKTKGRKLNKLCNRQWDRCVFLNTLTKWCNIYDVKLLKVKAEYSSFIGNIVNRSLRYPDMVLSSIEISRRGYEFYHQYVLKDKNLEKNIISIKLTDSIKNKVLQSLEELQNVVEFESLIDLYYSLKKLKCKYRFPLDIPKSFSLKVFKFQQILI